MRSLIFVLCVAALAGCGIDSMSAASTAAALKKQELQQGKTNMEQFQQKLGQAMQQTEKRAQQMDEAATK